MLTLSSNSRRHNGREIFEQGLREIGVLIPEYRFHKTRAWRFDYYLSNAAIAIEIEGAVFTGGRHNRGTGFIQDTDKYNTATCIGISVYRVTTKDLSDPDRIREHLAAIGRLYGRRSNILLDVHPMSNDVYAKRKPKKKVHKLKVPK